MKNYNYHPMQMHLHTCYQASSSMESQIWCAHKLGMNYMRITDHDSTICRTYTPTVDFSNHLLEYTDANGIHISYAPIGETALGFEGDALCVSSEEDGGVSLATKNHWHMITLLAEPVLTISATLKSGTGTVVITLSERPPELECAKLTVPLKEGENKLILKLAEMVNEDIGALDNCITAIDFTVSGGALNIDSLEFDCIHGAEEIFRRQSELAEKIGAKYHVKPFVTYEVSAAGNHKNCYSTCVPPLDYSKYDRPLTNKEGADYVLSHGGIFGYNHPLNKVAAYNKKDCTDAQLDAVVRATAGDLIASKVYGASAIEIGYPGGRGAGYTLERYLALWDILSSAGIFITGVGASDSHSSTRGWLTYNNFSTSFAVSADIPFPVPEQEFNDSLKAGRAFTSDPTLPIGKAELVSGENPMGAIIPVTRENASDSRTYTFKADYVGEAWKMRVIADGEVYLEETLTEGAFEYSYELAPLRTVSFTRVELYDADGRCVLLTNPIYVVNTDNFVGEIPECRVYGG